MFDFVRKHTKIMMFVMFLLIIPSFVLFGIDGYNRFRDTGAAVARVAGQTITQADWDAAHRMESERLRASMPNLDAKLLDSPQARYATLERLVRDKVLAQAVETFRLTTTDARLARELQENPTIASLRLPDGKLDMDRYRQLAATQGLTPEGFEARVRQDLSLRQVQSAVVATAFATPAAADLALNAFFERRDIQVANFLPADFAAKVTVSDADVEAYHKANPGLFQAAEQATVEYVVLDLDSVKKSIVISESDLKTYFEQNAARLSGTEERRASHILINAPKDAPQSERDKAKARAQELLTQVKKNPGTFAEVARKNSQDTGSAAKGGDLDFFARGAMVKPFEDAAFALKKGDISDVVASDFGYHIIQLTDIKAPVQRSFEDLRATMEADLKTQQAQRKFAESAEAFTNAVYEQADSLKPAADKLKLEIKTVPGIGRNPAPGAKDALASAKFLTALFSPDSIEKKRNTEAIEIGPNRLAAGRIAQYAPARTLPFEEVRAQARERLLSVRSQELARKEGADKLAAWQSAPDSATLPAAVVVSRDKPNNMGPKLLNAALRAPTQKLPALVGVDLGEQGYAVVRVNKIVPREAQDAAAAAQDRSRYAQWWADAESQAYYAFLKEHFKVEILASKPSANAALGPQTAGVN